LKSMLAVEIIYCPLPLDKGKGDWLYKRGFASLQLFLL